MSHDLYTPLTPGHYPHTPHTTHTTPDTTHTPPPHTTHRLTPRCDSRGNSTSSMDSTGEEEATKNTRQRRKWESILHIFIFSSTEMHSNNPCNFLQYFFCSIFSFKLLWCNQDYCVAIDTDVLSVKWSSRLKPNSTLTSEYTPRRGHSSAPLM